jgi:hypothetical protein
VRTADRAPKEFSDVYPQAAVKIQMLCEAATKVNLPPIWKLLANLKKKKAVMAVSQLIEARARNVDSYKVAPVVTPELLERIYSFKAGSVDVDDITAGFSLFLLSTGSPEANTQARGRSVVHGMLHGGQVASSLDQLHEIVTTAPQMARTLIGLERNYQGYSTLLDVLLGIYHWVALYFRAFLDSFQSLKLAVEEQFGAEIHAALPLFQRHTQLTMPRYYNMSLLWAPTPGSRVSTTSSTSSSTGSGPSSRSSRRVTPTRADPPAAHPLPRLVAAASLGPEPARRPVQEGAVTLTRAWSMLPPTLF